MQVLPRESFSNGDERHLLTGLLGRDILGSSSPKLHEAEAEAQGLRLTYLLFDFAQRGWPESRLPAVLEALATLGFAGVNVTHPFKQSVMAHLDALSPGAELVGAVNTVSFADGRLTGYNTDVIGFEESMRTGLPGAALDHVVQYGAGGGGAATAHALLAMGTQRLTLFDADGSRAETLRAELARHFSVDRVDIGTDAVAAARSAGGFVNATPIGMENYPGSAIPVELLEPHQWVADIVYFPLKTQLLAEARARGCRTLDGGRMVVFQAAAAYEIFTGCKADPERMLESFMETVRNPATRVA